jgi:hypothetical protein
MLRTGLTLSSSEAKCRTVDSASHAETTCIAMGNPSWLVPKRIESGYVEGHGRLMMFKAGTDWPLMTNSVAPCLCAGTGVTGQNNAS